MLDSLEVKNFTVFPDGEVALCQGSQRRRRQKRPGQDPPCSSSPMPSWRRSQRKAGSRRAGNPPRPRPSCPPTKSRNSAAGRCRRRPSCATASSPSSRSRPRVAATGAILAANPSPLIRSGSVDGGAGQPADRVHQRECGGRRRQHRHHGVPGELGVQFQLDMPPTSKGSRTPSKPGHGRFASRTT